MGCPLALFTGPWADLPLDELAGLAAGWSYRAVELAAWGDHLEVQRCLGDPAALDARADLLRGRGLEVTAVSCHRVSAAICEVQHGGLRHLLPEYVWGDGEPEGIRQRAVSEVIATARVASRLGAPLLTGFTGSAIWSRITGYPRLRDGELGEALADFSRRFRPILAELRELEVANCVRPVEGWIQYYQVNSERNHRDEGGNPEFSVLDGGLLLSHFFDLQP